MPPLPLGESWGEGGISSSPVDSPQVMPPLPLGEGWGEGGISSSPVNSPQVMPPLPLGEGEGLGEGQRVLAYRSGQVLI
jgi:hypothetical protein